MQSLEKQILYIPGQSGYGALSLQTPFVSPLTLPDLILSWGQFLRQKDLTDAVRVCQLWNQSSPLNSQSDYAMPTPDVVQKNAAFIRNIELVEGCHNLGDVYVAREAALTYCAHVESLKVRAADGFDSDMDDSQDLMPFIRRNLNIHTTDFEEYGLNLSDEFMKTLLKSNRLK
ncbi:hypothetical protein BGZ58_003752 [Dissophora ornata]|nr:hypothetical protein BGZ58_003752 [Dissophora ornata]